MIEHQNNVSLIGIIKSIPEYQLNEDGTRFRTLELITEIFHTNKSGDTKVIQTTHKIMLWNSICDVCNELKSGDTVSVVGFLKNNDGGSQNVLNVINAKSCYKIK